MYKCSCGYVSRSKWQAVNLFLLHLVIFATWDYRKEHKLVEAHSA